MVLYYDLPLSIMDHKVTREGRSLISPAINEAENLRGQNYICTCQFSCNYHTYKITLHKNIITLIQRNLSAYLPINAYVWVTL